jgi:cytochrome c oxidase subunit IV
VAQGSHDDAGLGADHGPGRYVLVWAVLVAFTLLTYTAWRISLPEPWHVIVALAIAAVKASLVALFFMELWEHRGATRLVFASSLVFVGLLIGLVVADSATRFPLANPPHEGTLQREPPLGAVPLPLPAMAPGAR